MTWIQETLKYPEECFFNQKLPKKQVYENTDLNNKNKKVFTKNIEEMRLTYLFSTDILNIPAYEDDIRKYSDVAIFEIELREVTELKMIAETILKNVPYPSLIIFEIDDYVRFYASHIREHRSDSSKITFDDDYGLIHTNFIDITEVDQLSEKLFNDLKLENLSHVNYYEFYKGIYNAILVYNASKLKEEQITECNDELKFKLDKILEIEYEMSQYETKIKEESNFSEKVELNMKIKQFQEEIDEIINQL